MLSLRPLSNLPANCIGSLTWLYITVYYTLPALTKTFGTILERAVNPNREINDHGSENLASKLTQEGKLSRKGSSQANHSSMLGIQSRKRRGVLAA